MRTRRSLAVLAVVALAVAACGTPAATSSAAPATTSTPSATTAVSAGKLTIYHEDNCQIELVDSSGRRILIDVYDPTLLSAPAKATDILLTTHLHSDHYNAAFESSFPGQKVTNEAGEFTFGDIHVTSIDASHIDDNILAGTDASNHIFVFDFDGFRIAHLGSTGQTKLTSDQLAKLGRVDIAFSPLQDVSGADSTGLRPIKLMEQLQPRLFVPTHSALATVQAAGKEWSGTFSSKGKVSLSRDQLPAKTAMLFLSSLAVSYGAILNLPETSW
jgi:hypothetical protein